MIIDDKICILQRWEFIKENKRVRKKENKNSIKKTRKKEIKQEKKK